MYLLTLRMTFLDEGLGKANNRLEEVVNLERYNEIPPGLEESIKGSGAEAKIISAREILGVAENLEDLLKKKPEDRCTIKMVKELGDLEIKYAGHEAAGSERLSSGAMRAGWCAGDVVREARATEANAEWWSKLWGRVSYGLFGVGWLLTLIGKLSKDENIEGESE